MLQVYQNAVEKLGDIAHAYSYWATSILAAYQRQIGDGALTEP